MPKIAVHVIMGLDASSSQAWNYVLFGVESNIKDHWCGWTRRGFYSILRFSNIYSVQFSCSVVSDSLRPHGLQHARPPCPSPTPGVYSNSCPLSWWCHPTISSSVVSSSSCPQSLPASGSFPMSQFFASGGQSIGVSASTSVLPMNTQDWSALWWTGWISLQSKGLSRVFSNTTVQKHQFFGTQVSLQSSSHNAAHFYIVRYNNNLNIKPVLGDKSIRIGMNLFYKNYYLQNFCKQQLLLILLNLVWPFHFF